MNCIRILGTAFLFCDLATTAIPAEQKDASALFDQLLALQSSDRRQARDQTEYERIAKRQEELVQNLTRICKDFPDKLVDRLRYDTQRVRGDEEALGWVVGYEILPILDRIGPSVSPHLRTVLDDGHESWLMRAWVASCLAYAKATNAVPSLARAASSRDSHPRLQQESVQAIGAIGVADKETIGLLLPLLSSTNELVKRFTIRTLGELASPEAAAPIRRLAEGQKGPAAWDAMHALVRIEGTNAIELLKKAVESGDRFTREHAFNCLGDINDPQAKAILRGRLLDADPRVAGEAAVYLHPHSSEDGLSDVLAAITERRKQGLAPAPEMVKRVAWVPGERGWKLALEYLDAAEPEYRCAAAKALGSRPEYRQAIVVLQQRLGRETDKEVRDWILTMLRNYNAVPEKAQTGKGKP